MAAGTRWLILLAHLNFFSAIIYGQMAPPGQPKFSASQEDLPFIKCSVCQKAVKHIKHEINKMRANAGVKKVDEDDILSVVEKSCNPDSTHGDWISRYDIIESSGNLKIFEQELHSKCKKECKTIAKACEESISEVDTDLGELLWKDKLTLSQLINKVCYEMTTVCAKKPPKYTKGKREDEVFVPMSDEEKKAFDVMKKMKSSPGMPGMEMYSKDDMANMQQQFAEPQGAEELPAKENIPDIPQSTNLGLAETIKASFQGLVNRVKSIFGFGQGKSEL